MKRFLYDNPVQRPSKSIANLVRIGKMFNRPVWLPAGDEVFLALKFRPILEKTFTLSLPPNEFLEYAADKALTMQLAQKEGIRIPKTFTPSTSDELSELKDELEYPVVIKPRISAGFREKYGTKTFKVWSFKQLTETYRGVSNYSPRPLIQEYIPGGTKNIYSLCTIFDAKHRPLGTFSIRKIRQLIEGVTACAESVDIPEIISTSLKILKTLRWIGPAEVEFKKDLRDCEFKLMEINPRPFMWVNLPIKSGLDIPYMWYRIALEGEGEEAGEIRKDLKFVNLFHHFLGFLRDLSSNQHGIRKITSYFEDLKGHFVFDILTKDDILPFISYPMLFLILRAKEAYGQKRYR